MHTTHSSLFGGVLCPGGLPDRNPPGQKPPATWQRPPLGRDFLDRDPQKEHGTRHRDPMEKRLPDRDLPGQKPSSPWQRTPGQRLHGQRPLWTETHLDRDRPWTETPLGERPPGRNMRPGSQTGSDMIKRHPLWTKWPTCVTVLPCPRLHLWAVNIWKGFKAGDTQLNYSKKSTLVILVPCGIYVAVNGGWFQNGFFQFLE